MVALVENHLRTESSVPYSEVVLYWEVLRNGLL